MNGIRFIAALALTCTGSLCAAEPGGNPATAGRDPAQSGIFTPDLTIPFQQGDDSLAVPQFGSFDSFDVRLPLMQTTPAAAMRGAPQAGDFDATMGATAGFAFLGGNLIGGPYWLFQIADKSEAAFEQAAGMLGLTLPTIHKGRN